jgi:hypothetical protein
MWNTDESGSQVEGEGGAVAERWRRRVGRLTEGKDNDKIVEVERRRTLVFKPENHDLIKEHRSDTVNIPIKDSLHACNSPGTWCLRIRHLERSLLSFYTSRWTICRDEKNNNDGYEKTSLITNSIGMTERRENGALQFANYYVRDRTSISIKPRRPDQGWLSEHGHVIFTWRNVLFVATWVTPKGGDETGAKWRSNHGIYFWTTNVHAMENRLAIHARKASLRDEKSATGTGRFLEGGKEESGVAGGKRLGRRFEAW